MSEPTPTRPEPTTPTREALEQLAIWPLLDAVSAGDGHSWVCHSTTDAELKTVVWCQWCGVHQCELPDWTDDPKCPAFEAMSHLKQHLTSEAAGPTGIETGWLIEYGAGCYFDGSHFQSDHLQAIRFARAEDAEKFARYRLRDSGHSWKVVEHSWGWGPKPEPAASVPVTKAPRNELGRAVRLAWIKWAKSQPSPKPSWLVPYEALNEADKEVDRQIGEYIEALTMERLALLAASTGARGAVVEEIAKRHEVGDFRFAMARTELWRRGQELLPQAELATLRRLLDEHLETHNDRATLLALIGAKQP